MMTGFRLLYLGATVALAFSALFNTTTSLLVRHLVDDVLSIRSVWGVLPPGITVERPQPLEISLLIISLSFIGISLLRGTSSFFSGAWASKTAENIARRLRNYLFDHIQRLTFTYHDTMKTGELVQRSTSDLDAIRRFFADQAIGVGRIAALFAINFVALLALHWQLALVSVVVVPLVVATSVFFFRRVSAAYESFQEQEAILSTTLQENLTGVRVVKAFARQDYEINKFEGNNWEKYRRGRKLTMMHSTFWPLSDILCSFQTLTGMFIGGVMVMDGTITLGTYLAYIGILVWIIWPMRNMGRLIVDMSTGMVSYDRVMEIIREEREPLGEDEQPPVKEIRGEIAFEDVNFEYAMGGQVLKNISFGCKPGQTVALLGSTGSGKTSLVSLLPRFYNYTSGSIMLDGIELTEFPRRFLRQNIGIVEQEPFLFSRSIRENITYGVGREVSDAEVEAAAKAAAAHDFIMQFPEDYNTLVGERGVTLSGGQKQRVAIARTLLKNPRILILDDATSSVDTETEGEIRGALKRLMVGRTSFIIAHRIQSVMNADLILVMDKGEIVQRGTHDELVHEPGIYRQVYDMQSRIEEELESEIASVRL
jgi:ATP-binding cassette subfamily B protein